MKSKDEKRFQFIGNVVMIIMTVLAVAPLLLVIISSFTDNNTPVSYTHLDVYKRQICDNMIVILLVRKSN